MSKIDAEIKYVRNETYMIATMKTPKGEIEIARVHVSLLRTQALANMFHHFIQKSLERFIDDTYKMETIFQKNEKNKND